MENNTPIHSKKTASAGILHTSEYNEFITWLALPKSIKNPKTQAELAKKLGVGPDTLSEWKQRDGFWYKVNEKMKTWAKEKTPDVIGILYDRIIKTGGASEIRIWLEWQKEIVSDVNTSKEVDELRQSVKKMMNSQRASRKNDYKGKMKEALE